MPWKSVLLYVLLAFVSFPCSGCERLKKARDNFGGGNDEVSDLADPKKVSVELPHESWFEKQMRVAINVAIGIAAISFALPILCTNERCAAKFESLMRVGRCECKTVKPSEASITHRGALVHVPGIAKGVMPLQDSRFECVQCDSGCLMIRSTVEVYQWEEQPASSEKQRRGDGDTRCTYKQTWSDRTINSDRFKEAGHKNEFPVIGLALGHQWRSCQRVELGEGYILPSSMIVQMNDWQCAGGPLQLEDTLVFSDFKFHLGPDNYYHFRKGSGPPQIGDTRVRIEYVPDGPVTVLALQTVGPDKDSRDSFAPYRVVPRGWFSNSENDLKKLRIAEAQKRASELHDGLVNECDFVPFHSLFCWCSCVHSVITMCLAGLAPPEMYHIFTGEWNRAECLNAVSLSRDTSANWLLRFVGWSLLFLGTYALLTQSETKLNSILPLGPHVTSFARGALLFFCLLITLAAAILITSAAHLLYNPAVACKYLAAGSMLTLGFIWFGVH